MNNQFWPFWLKKKASLRRYHVFGFGMRLLICHGVGSAYTRKLHVYLPPTHPTTHPKKAGYNPLRTFRLGMNPFCHLVSFLAREKHNYWTAASQASQWVKLEIQDRHYKFIFRHGTCRHTRVTTVSTRLGSEREARTIFEIRKKKKSLIPKNRYQTMTKKIISCT